MYVCMYVCMYNDESPLLHVEGWLPQTVIDQTPTGVLNTSMDTLKAYVSDVIVFNRIL